MNCETTRFQNVSVKVESYSDGVYNLVIRKDNFQEERISVDKKEAHLICDLMGVDTPVAVSKPPERWE